MSPRLSASAALLGLAVSGSTLAAENCTDPVANWQPRERLRQQVEKLGWTVQRIKVDDGCYEVRGLDRKGNPVEADYAPASLRIRTLKINFREEGDASDYLKAHP